MDQLGFSYELYKKFLIHLGYSRVDECCIGNIEVWEKGLDITTFSTDSPNITENRMPDLVTDVGKEMRDFYLFVEKAITA